MTDAGLFSRQAQLVHQNGDDSLLHGGADVRQIFANEPRISLRLLAEKIKDGGFEARKAKVETGYLRFGELETRLPLLGEFVDEGASGVFQAQQLARFVEGFTGCVVKGGAEDFHVEVVIDADDLRVAPRNGKTKKGKGWMWFFGKVGQHVGLHVVYLYEGNAQRLSKTLGKGRTHDEGTDEARASCKGNGIEGPFFNASFFQRCIYYRDDVLLVGSRGNLRHHAAVQAVDFLAGHDVARYTAVYEDGGGSIVARTFDSKNDYWHVKDILYREMGCEVKHMCA